MNKISFKANININPAKIQTASRSDKFFIEKVNGQNLDAVIQKVASLATIKRILLYVSHPVWIIIY